MKKQLINEVKQLQKIAGILKEYIESDPETITQAFQKAGIDLKKPVTYILDAGRGATDKPVKMLGSGLLRKLEAMRAEGEANNPNYNEEEGVTYYFEPDGGEGPDFKLGVQFSDSLLYDIYQAKEMNEWHPDDPSSTEIDDTEEDPEDFDDISERKKGDLSDYVVKNNDGNFYIDQEDPDTGEAVASPGDSFMFTYEGRQYRATVTNKDFGRNGVYLLRLADEDFDDISEGVDPIEVFNFGYDLEAVDALSNYVKSKYHVVDQQDDTTGADAAEWVERGDTTMNALEIYNPAILKDPMFKKLLQSCEGKGRFDDDGDVMENINEIDQKVLKAIEAYVDSKLGVVGSSEVVKKAINHIVAAYKKEKPTRKLGTFVKNHFDDYADRNIHYSELL